ncbi:MAG: HEAT repeat domain-containing protein [Chloroflexaceae bacterium]
MTELEVSDSWQETLRLLVADARDDDVDEVLLAILEPLANEDPERTTRPRAVLAARCLADEPDIAEETARQVLETFVAQVRENDGDGDIQTSVDKASVEVGHSLWLGLLESCLLEEFFRGSSNRLSCAGLWATVAGDLAPTAPEHLEDWLSDCIARLLTADDRTAASSALAIMQLVFNGKLVEVPNMVEALLHLLQRPEPVRMAAAWALCWLSQPHNNVGTVKTFVWQPDIAEIEILSAVLQQVQATSVDTTIFLIYALQNSGVSQAVEPLLACLDNPDAGVRRAVASALGQIGDARAVEPLLAHLNDPDTRVQWAIRNALRQLVNVNALKSLLTHLDDPDAAVRQTIAELLGQIGDARAVEPLLTRLDDPNAGVRWAVVQALGRIGDVRAVEPLLARLNDPDTSMRQTVVQALGQIGDVGAVEPLLARLDDPDTHVRRAAVEALGRIGDARAVEPLLARLEDPDAELQLTVAAALERCNNPQGAQVLPAALSDPDSDRRKMAVQAFAVVRDRTTGRLLSHDLDALAPWLDPATPITMQRVEAAATALEMSVAEVQVRYEALAGELPLILAWRTPAGDEPPTAGE